MDVDSYYGSSLEASNCVSEFYWPRTVRNALVVNSYKCHSEQDCLIFTWKLLLKVNFKNHRQVKYYGIIDLSRTIWSTHALKEKKESLAPALIH